ncbi:Uncharacterised protein [Klebsiella oxytoca]|nr:Uncharacterised protein [Klebsiella oxytoca]
MLPQWGKRQRRYQLVTQQLIADLRQVIETADMLPTQLQRAKIAAARNDIPALQPTVAVEKKMRVGVGDVAGLSRVLKNKAISGNAIGQRQHRKHAAGGIFI